MSQQTSTWSSEVFDSFSDDERAEFGTGIEVDPKLREPFDSGVGPESWKRHWKDWTCKLIFSFSGSEDQSRIGTGFFLNIPHIKKNVILTAAHNLIDQTTGGRLKCLTIHYYDDEKEKEYVVDVETEIHIPQQKEFMRLSQYLQGGSNEDDEYDERIPEVDYGFILLPLTHEKRRYNLFKSTEPVRKSRVGFGLGLDLAYVEFGKMSPPAAVYIAGYPNDLKKPGFRYVAGYHTMEDALPYGQLHYKADTSCGYSGGPIIVRSGQEFACIGIHNHGAKTAGSGKEFASRGRKITADLIREVYAAAHVNEAQFSNLCIDIFRSDPSASRLVLGLREWSSSNRLHGGRLRANPTLLKPFVRKDSGTDMDSTSFSIMPVAATCGDMLDSEAFHVYYAVVHFLSPSDHSKRCRDTPRVPYFLQLLPSQKYEPENRYACDICATRVLTKSALLKLELPDKRVFPEPELIKEIIKKRKQDDSIPLWFNSAPLVLRTSQRKVGANNEDMGYTCLYARAEDVGIGEDEEESTTGQVTTIGLEEAVAMMQDARPRKKKLLAKEIYVAFKFTQMGTGNTLKG